MYLITILLRPKYLFLTTRATIYETKYENYFNMTKIVSYNEQNKEIIIHKVHIVYFKKIIKNAFYYSSYRREQCHRKR
jgi:hypothetical protein